MSWNNQNPFGGPPPHAQQGGFGPVPPGAAPAQFGPPPGAGFGGGFGGGGAMGMTADQALAGFGNAAIDVRFPFLPVGCAVAYRIASLGGRGGQQIPFAVYMEGTCIAVSNPGGGQEPPPDSRGVRAWPENANPMPASIGTDYTIRIDGFGRPESEKFAMSDYKALLEVLFSDPAQLAGAVQAMFTPPAEAMAQLNCSKFSALPPQLQDMIGRACLPDATKGQALHPALASVILGQVIVVQTKVVGGGPKSRTGKRKLSCVFYPASVAGLPSR